MTDVGQSTVRAYDGGAVRISVTPRSGGEWQWVAYTPMGGTMSTAPSREEAYQRAEKALRDHGCEIPQRSK